jgi:hypothetical protein
MGRELNAEASLPPLASYATCEQGRRAAHSTCSKVRERRKCRSSSLRYKADAARSCRRVVVVGRAKLLAAAKFRRV